MVSHENLESNLSFSSPSSSFRLDGNNGFLRCFVGSWNLKLGTTKNLVGKTKEKTRGWGGERVWDDSNEVLEPSK